MNISFNLTQSTDELEKIILHEYAKVLNIAFNKSLTNIKTKVGEFTKQLLDMSPEIDSLLNGKLGQELGLSNPAQAVAQIKDALAGGIEVSMQPVRVVSKTLVGSIIIILVKGDFSDILGISEAKYMSGKNEIPWVEWLLFKGDSIIIADYSIEYKQSSKSRTGNAVMVKNKKGWRVPPEFSGTQDNNFITRAFIDYTPTEKTIGKIVEEEIVKGLP